MLHYQLALFALSFTTLMLVLLKMLHGSQLGAASNVVQHTRYCWVFCALACLVAVIGDANGKHKTAEWLLLTFHLPCPPSPPPQPRS